jgi:hypothetical protein
MSGTGNRLRLVNQYEVPPVAAKLDEILSRGTQESGAAASSCVSQSSVSVSQKASPANAP